MIKVALPEMQRGKWRIEHFVVDRIDFGSLSRGRAVPVGGEYTRLMRDGTLVMSDTPAEMHDHQEAIMRAKGNCLLNGLGIGMVLKNILLKPEVKSVIVVEISEELIDMISPHYSDARVSFVCTSAFDYQPILGMRYQMVWHDIWDNICGDNLPDMIRLHRKYGRRSDWQGSWCRYECDRQR